MRIFIFLPIYQTLAFRLRQDHEQALSFFHVPSVRSAVYSAESWISTGDEKKELKLKAAVEKYMSRGETDGEAASKLMNVMQHPEQYELDSAKVTAVVQSMANSKKYDLNKAKQSAQQYQTTAASVAASMGTAGASPMIASGTTPTVVRTPISGQQTVATSPSAGVITPGVTTTTVTGVQGTPATGVVTSAQSAGTPTVVTGGGITNQPSTGGQGVTTAHTVSSNANLVPAVSNTHAQTTTGQSVSTTKT